MRVPGNGTAGQAVPKVSSLASVDRLLAATGLAGSLALLTSIVIGLGAGAVRL